MRAYVSFAGSYHQHLINHIGSLGYHVETYRSKSDPDWVELVAVAVESGERFRVEGDDYYEAACAMALLVGIDLEA